MVGNVVRFVDLDSVQGSKDFNNNEAKVKLFDNNSSTKFLTNQGVSADNPVWVSFQLKEPKAIKAYSVVSANDAEGRDPVDWTFSGSNDGSDLDGIGQPKRDRV